MTSTFYAILLSMAVYGLLHSLAASLGAKALARRWLGPAAARWYRLAFSLFGGLSLLPVLALMAWLPDRSLYRLALPWALPFLAVQAGGLVLFAWSLLVTDVWSFIGLRPASDAGHTGERLVIDGPYRWVRHPMYTASLLVLWFTPLMSEGLLAFNLGTTLYFVIGGLFEERKLLRQFGPAYAEYRRRTPMLIPGLPRRD
jgi:protein-S-isoprenylcysteine O-methyltransferase Ste14